MGSARWASRPGFLLATVGAAVGLGNIWRFAAVLAANGGGAYLVPNLLAAVGLVVYAATLPGWERAVGFPFTPDFAVLADPGLWSAAVGQVFFFTSVGQGIMLTYGSDVDADADLLRSSLAKERPRRAGRLLALDIADGTVRWAVDTASPRRNA